MIKLIGEKVLLREATQEDVNTLYYWKYEEKNKKRKMECSVHTRSKADERKVYEFMGRRV